MLCIRKTFFPRSVGLLGDLAAQRKSFDFNPLATLLQANLMSARKVEKERIPRFKSRSHNGLRSADGNSTVVHKCALMLAMCLYLYAHG